MNDVCVQNIVKKLHNNLICLLSDDYNKFLFVSTVSINCSLAC